MVVIAEVRGLSYVGEPMHSCGSRRSQTLSRLKSQAVAAGIISFLFCAPLKASPWVELQLDAPLGCPNRAAIEAAVNRLVQRAPQAPLRVSARFAPDGNRWVLFAVFENGQRVIPGDSCLAVAEALVVILALAIDPTASQRSTDFSDLQRRSAPNAPAPNGTTPVAAPPAGPAPSAKRATDQRWDMPTPDLHDSVPQRQKQQTRLGMSFLMLAETGALPTSSYGPALFARYGTPSYWGEFSVSGLLPRFKGTTRDRTKGGYIGWFAGQLAGCAAPVQALPLAGCLGAELGEMVGRGENTGHNTWAYALWYAASASAVFRTELHRDLGLELRLGAAVPFAHPPFGLQGYGTVFAPEWVSLRAMVGFSWR